ncbi:hypothetical protein HMN09_00021600 [Mycena chlorophos]|uniref:EH domain-containing protein n=1 Tax=Mycena chlorophos TaxID=658473 RepID=A0A8H6TVD5_MYCCL|nr:hypothetical protein HMN09_00021600 [Mycena chlorophos]
MSVQSRIHAFETGAVLQPRIIPSTPPQPSPSPSPPNLGRKSSLIDLKIDLKDWVFDEGSPPRPSGFRRSKKDDEDALKSTTSLPPLKPPSLTTPPLPKRNDSLSVEHTYPPVNGGSPTALSPGRHTHGSSISSLHSVSLSDGSPSPSTAVFPQHRTPTENNMNIPTPTTATEHTTGSSGSVGSESFEELTASVALASPATAEIISHDWDRAMAAASRKAPPKLPPRPATTQFSPPPTRRPVPPPPSGDKASIRSFASASSSASASTSRTSSSASIPSKPVFQFSPVLKPTPSPPPPALTSRPPPVPPGPRKRYDALFTSVHAAQSTQSQKTLSPPKRRAAGWRGLSVDLIEGEIVTGDTLAASVVRAVWCRSKLPNQILSSIWVECDPQRTGALDREAFARGMWRIDEELRHAAEASSGSSRRTRLR